MEAAIGFLIFIVIYVVVVVATLRMKQPPLPFKAMTALYLGIYYSVAMQTRHLVTMYHLKKTHKHKIALMNSEFKYKVLTLNMKKNMSKCDGPSMWEAKEEEGQ